MIEITWTAASLDEARKVARHLVQQRLVACCQIIPWIESVYIWDGQMETVQESKVVIKTKDELFDNVKSVIESMSSYEVPEILSVKIERANKAYAEWLNSAINPQESLKG